MARPITIDDETILDAARTLFSERGLSVTTADVAKRAGVSEGSIFRRFESKKKLFAAAMTNQDPDWLDWLEPSTGGETLRETLEQISDSAIDHFLIVLPLFYRMVGSGLIEPHQLASAFNEPHQLYAVRTLTRYLESERRLGRIRAADPEVVARGLLGALHMFAFFEIMGFNALQPMPRATFVRGLVGQTLVVVANEA